jgi:hypothetical protein
MGTSAETTTEMMSPPGRFEFSQDKLYTRERAELERFFFLDDTDRRLTDGAMVAITRSGLHFIMGRSAIWARCFLTH